MTKLLDKEIIWYKGKEYILKESIVKFISQRENPYIHPSDFYLGYNYCLLCIKKAFKDKPSRSKK